MINVNNILVGFIIFTLVFYNLSCQSQTSNLPNIVLIMADDMGYESLGCNGSTEYETPNLDRLASTGVRFEHCYSQPLCTPSRVKIMTGKFNFRNYEDFGYLNPNQTTFGNILQQAGYATCIAGKWQLNGLNHNNIGHQDANRPNHFGFEEYCLWQLNRTRAEGERYANPLITENGEDLPRDEDAYGPQIFADYICNFIDRKASEPFFVYYPMVLVHDPFVPTPDSPEWDTPSLRYKNDTAFYADMMHYTDKIIGQIETKLKENGIWENTIFIFTADNGTHPSVISNTKNGKIRGGKGKTSNTGNHVPMIISWPNEMIKGTISSKMIDFADFLPTLADIAGVSPNSYLTDGESFSDLLSGNKRNLQQSEIFIHYTPRWGKFEHNRWVMNQEFKLYRDGRFFNTIIDTDEKKSISNLSEEEQIIKKKFEEILTKKENEFPFNWNDKEYDSSHKK